MFSDFESDIDYLSLMAYCEDLSLLSRRVIDDWLLEYSAVKNGYDKEFDKRLKREKRKFKELPAEAINLMRAQYVYHQIFGYNQKIRSYLKHKEIKLLPKDEYEYLELMSEEPSRFVCAFLLEKVAPDFYRMADLITGEIMLVYSTSVTTILNQDPYMQSWFIQVHYNRKCFQTFGILQPFRSIAPFDLAYIAAVVCDGETKKEIDEAIQKDPFRFFPMLAFSRLPVITHKGEQVLSCITEVELDNNSITQKLLTNLGKQLKSDSVGQVTRFVDPELAGFPHFGRIYFDGELEILHITTQTKSSFSRYAKILNDCGLELHDLPDQTLSFTAMECLNMLTNEVYRADYYEDDFKGAEFALPSSGNMGADDFDEYGDATGIPEFDDEFTDKMNSLLSEIIPLVNASQPIPEAELAEKHNMPLNLVQDLVKNTLDATRKMPGE